MLTHTFKLSSPWGICHNGNRSFLISIVSSKGAGLCLILCRLIHTYQEEDGNCFYMSAHAVFPGVTQCVIVLRLFLENELL